MTPTNDHDFIREINRRLRDLSWRVERLESTQMPPRSLNDAFDRIYDEIDTLDRKMDSLQQEVRELQQEVREGFNSLDAKFEIIMRHITGN